MYKNEFEKILKSGNIPNAVMLYGESDFLLDLYLEKYTKSIPQNLNELKLYYNDYSLDLAQSHLAEPSLFSDGNLLIIKCDKKLDAKNINAILDLIERYSNNYFLLYYKAEDAKSKAIYFEKRKFPAVRFFEPNHNEAKIILQELATKDNIVLNNEALDLILKLNDYNLSITVGELEKIKILDDKSIENIQNIIAGHLTTDPFKIISAIINKKKFWHMIENLYENGIDEYKIVLDLQRSFFQLFGLFASKKLFGNRASSLDFLGYSLPVNLEQERSSMAIRLTHDHYLHIFSTLLELEERLKSANIGSKEALLHSYLIKLQRAI